MRNFRRSWPLSTAFLLSSGFLPALPRAQGLPIPPLIVLGDTCLVRYETLVAKPVAYPPPGEYAQGVTVRFVTETPGARIHLTWDGSLPDTSSLDVTDLSISLTRDATFRAIAIDAGGEASETLVAGYVIKPIPTAARRAPGDPGRQGMRNAWERSGRRLDGARR